MLEQPGSHGLEKAPEPFHVENLNALFGYLKRWLIIEVGNAGGAASGESLRVQRTR